MVHERKLGEDADSCLVFHVQPECEGAISPVGDIAHIGSDASGVVCSTAQIR